MIHPARRAPAGVALLLAGVALLLLAAALPRAAGGFAGGFGGFGSLSELSELPEDVSRVICVEGWCCVCSDGCARVRRWRCPSTIRLTVYSINPIQHIHRRH